MTTKAEPDEMARQYDFSHGPRGRFSKVLEKGYDIVVDGQEDQPIHVSVEEIQASQWLLEAGRRKRRVAERG